MTGLIRIVDEAGEREKELGNEPMSIGSSRSDSLRVLGNAYFPSVATISWDARRATWVLYCALPLPLSVTVNRRPAAPGEQVPLANLDVIEVAGAILQFQRILAPPLVRGQPKDRIPLRDATISIGRGDPQGTSDATRVDLDSQETSISRVHVVVEREKDDYYVGDRSRLGAELNGIAFTRERLVFGDRLRIAGYIFEFTGDALRLIYPETSGTVSAEKVSVEVSNGRVILDQISLNIPAGEFVGVLGASGHGKSTFLNALCGINPPTSGEVTLGGISLSDRAGLRAIGIGFVPQDDIVHRELTVLDAITFSARLRLRLTKDQIDALVSRVATRLGLGPHLHQKVEDLSGGQRKRVSIAIELLAKPSILFLDEPSSGLDPATEEALMTLLQSLTLTKLTVVCTTHVLQKAYLFDRILFIQAGRLVFAGHISEARSYFLSRSADDDDLVQHSPIERIYGLLGNTAKSAAEWEREFKESRFAERALPLLPSTRGTVLDRDSAKNLRVNPLKVFLLLVERQWRILKSNPMNLVFLLVQPALIGFLVAWVADKSALRMFLCIVATMWFGCSNGAQQIVSELPIFRRERVSGQGLNAYILSKVGFLSSISLLQALLLLLITLIVTPFFHGEKPDRANLLKDFGVRLAPPAVDLAAVPGDDFEVLDADAPVATPAAPTPTPAQPAVVKAPSPVLLAGLITAAEFFQISQNILDSGPRIIARADGTPWRNQQGQVMAIHGLRVPSVIATTLGLRWLAVAAAAVTGVAIGLAVSSLVTNTTQAVLWVPLILIPQILFGGVVVAVPDMSRSVRIFSHVMPSFAAQRIMDVAALYGLTTPFITNRTKTPQFLTSRGDKETVDWQMGDRSYQQSYDKVSPVNASWQNMAVIPERLGQHKQVADVMGLSHRDYRDTVEQRRDVMLSKGTPFRSLDAAQSSTALLLGWNFCCYGVIAAALRRKQTGK